MQRPNFMGWLSMRRWSPYLVGALIGLLAWFTAASADKMLGTSTTFVRVAGLIESGVAPDHVKNNTYYTEEKVKVDWQMMLVLGLLIGTGISRYLSGDREVERVPQYWKHRFGPRIWKRYVGALIGGFLVLFGARLAGGCTSGHGISGALQLSISGWAFFAAVFLSGVAAALAVYGRQPSS